MADDAGRWGRAEADAVLATVLADRDVAGSPVLLCEAATFVYRVGNVVAKVYSPTALAERYERAAMAGIELAASSVPVLAALDGGRFTRTGAGSVGFWPFVRSVRAATWADLGSLLRACHATDRKLLQSVDLPAWEPVVTTRWATGLYRRRADADHHLADTIDRAGEALSERLKALTAEPSALVHGDAQLQNVVVGDDGPQLLDLDWRALGPSVVDTAAVVRAHRNGTLANEGFAEFVESYGTDPASAVGTEVLVAAGDFSEIVFRLAMACRRDEPVDWLRRAMATLN